MDLVSICMYHNYIACNNYCVNKLLLDRTSICLETKYFRLRKERCFTSYSLIIMIRGH